MKQNTINNFVLNTVKPASTPGGNTPVTQKSSALASQIAAPASLTLPASSPVQHTIEKPIGSISSQDSGRGTPSVIIPISANKPNSTLPTSSERAPMTPSTKLTISISQGSIVQSAQSKAREASSQGTNGSPAPGNDRTPTTTTAQTPQKSASVAQNPTSLTSNHAPADLVATPASKAPEISQASSTAIVTSPVCSQSARININDKPSTIGTTAQSIADAKSSSQITGSPLASLGRPASSSQSHANNPNPAPTQQATAPPSVQTPATTPIVPKTSRIIIKFSPKKTITTENGTENSTSTQSGSTQSATVQGTSSKPSTTQGTSLQSFSTEDTSSQSARTQCSTPTVLTSNRTIEVTPNSQLTPIMNSSSDISRSVGPPLSDISSPNSQSDEDEVRNSSIPIGSFGTGPNYSTLIL